MDADVKNINGVVDDMDTEKEHFQRIVNAFKFYGVHSLDRVKIAEMYYEELPEDHKRFIPKFTEKLNHIRSCVEHNYKIIKMMIQDVDYIFENRGSIEASSCDTFPDNVAPENGVPPTVNDMDKLHSTLKQFSRDWSESGERERQTCYKPVMDEILSRFKMDECDRNTVSVLVPGAGLGRLAFEIARLGYTCQGNEWSLFMLFASNFVLNKCKDVNSFKLYPWIHQWVNNKKSDDQIAYIKFPDVNPSEIPQNANFSMAAGDFLEVYTEEASWDCVSTVFFIDTAHNIIAYIETIWKILKPGGVWINIGPLLYHYAEMKNESSIELSYDELRHVIKEIGFVIEKEEMDVKTSYTQNSKSMLRYEYDSVFFAATKPIT